ncbi:MAG: hypothetical protein ACK5NG_10785, partial [Chthoniobacterales bacterium]
LFFIHRKVKAINESLASIFIGAINETIDPDQEWFRLSPLGEHENEVGLQVVDKASSVEIVRAFNSVLGKLGRLWRGLPIYVGHPSNPERRAKNTEIYAKYPHPVGCITAMELRGD